MRKSDGRLPEWTHGLGVVEDGNACYDSMESIGDGGEDPWGDRILRVGIGKSDRVPYAHGDQAGNELSPPAPSARRDASGRVIGFPARLRRQDVEYSTCRDLLTRYGDRSIIMPMHRLLVVAMLLQSLALVGPAQPAAAPVASGACSSAATCCCTGETGPDRCAPDGQAVVCMCGPGVPDDGSKAPLPRDGTQRAPFLALVLSNITVVLPEPSRAVLRQPGTPSPVTTHNEIQALLCVWRT
jgi:hypothetical protein